jgi:rubrerythrin
MPTAALIFAYVALTLGALAVLVVYSELRQRRFQPTASPDRIFRCAACNWVYTDDPDVDRSRCPHCGRMNAPIEF